MQNVTEMTVPPSDTDFSFLFQRIPALAPKPPVSRIHQSFLNLKSNLELNDSFGEVIQQKHNAVRSLIENSGLNVDTKLIGSVARKTRIQPLSEDETFDIDILVVLGEFTGWTNYGGISPRDALACVQSVVEGSSRYASMNPVPDEPTVTFEYKDNVKIELVPAYRDKVGYSSDGITCAPIGRGYWIPKDGKWQLADYDYEADYISRMNTHLDGWLVPTIKMLKAVRREYLPEMKSFHLEVLAVNLLTAIIGAKRKLNMSITYPSLISGFFSAAENFVLPPAKIADSNSGAITLGPASSLKIHQNIIMIKNFCKNLETLVSEEEKLKNWKILFGDPFQIA